MLMRKMKANVMRNATKKNKKNYFIVFDYYSILLYSLYSNTLLTGNDSTTDV